MSAAAEEAGEEVEGVVVAASAARAALLVLFYAFVAVLVVDSAEFGVDQRFVSIGDVDEFLLGVGIVGVFVWVVLFAEGAVGFFDLAVVGVFV